MRTATYVSGLVIALGVGSSAHHAVATADDHGPMFKLVDDAAQRLLTADPVAASKYLTGGSVDDPTREQQVLDSVDGLARAHHVDQDFIRNVFRDQIDATDSVEHSLFAEWKIGSGSVPRTAPDLSSSRDAIDELNQAMVVDVAQQWNALPPRPVQRTSQRPRQRCKLSVIWIRLISRPSTTRRTATVPDLNRSQGDEPMPPTEPEWGPERYGLAQDDTTFSVVTDATRSTTTEGAPVRATTAVFFVIGRHARIDSGYTQHMQDFHWEHGERDLLQRAVDALASHLKGYDRDGVDIGVVDDHTALRAPIAAFDIPPPPPTGEWGAALVAVYAPHALTTIGVGITVVKSPHCQLVPRLIVAQAMSQLLKLHHHAP